MKKFIGEFKEFALKGNVIDMAVGIVIGGSFKGIVDSLVADVINPIIGLVANKDFSENIWSLGEVSIRYGAFVSSIINFFLMALVIFMVVKVMNKARALGAKPAPAPAPVALTTKACPYCLSSIPLAATRCAHCTSTLS